MLSNADPENADLKPSLGDVNDDGLTNNLDAILIFNWTLGNAEIPHFENSDIRVDGLVNNMDAIILFNWTLGNVEILPLR